MPKVVPEYKAQARARIIEAAITVLRRRGLGGNTMDDIAREIGVSKGALYLYFPSKTQLLVAVLGQLREEIMKEVERRVEEGDPAEGFAAALDAVFSRAADPSSVWNMLSGAFATSASDPEVREAMRLDQRDDTRILRSLLRRLEAKGRIPRMMDPEVVADAVLLLMSGSIVAAGTQGDPAASQRSLVRALRLVLGLSSRTAPRATRQRVSP